MFFTCLLSFLVNNNIILNKIVFYTIIIKVLPLQWHLGLKGLNLPQKKLTRDQHEKSSSYIHILLQ